jgi:transposase
MTRPYTALSTAQAAERLGVSRVTFYNWVRAGKAPAPDYPAARRNSLGRAIGGKDVPEGDAWKRGTIAAFAASAYGRELAAAAQRISAGMRAHAALRSRRAG